MTPDGDAATGADILACFRLLLGRPPGDEERVGHLSQTGRPLADVVRGYLGSEEFRARRLLQTDLGGWALTRTAHGFAIFASPDDAAVGAAIVASGCYEPGVTAVFERFLRPGLRVLDIGANIGWFTMLAASRVGADGQVVAVEPNPANARMLEASRRANGFAHVTLLPVAAGDRNGAVALHRIWSNGGTTSLDRVDVASAEIVPLIRLDDVLPPAPGPLGLLKIDVEGAEGLALAGLERTLRRDHPVLLSEFSPGMMPGASGMSGRAYAAWLGTLGYDLSVIASDGAATRLSGPDDALDAHAASGVDHIDLLAEPR